MLCFFEYSIKHSDFLKKKKKKRNKYTEKATALMYLELGTMKEILKIKK